VLHAPIPSVVGSTQKQKRAKLGYIGHVRHISMSHIDEILRVPTGSTGESVESGLIAGIAYFGFAGHNELDFRECVVLPQCGHGCFCLLRRGLLRPC
jgi:hypothetical protein